MTKKLSQADRILKRLIEAEGGWISAKVFKIDMMITETNARISELRNKGYDVETRDVRDEYGFAYHRIKVKEPKQLELVK